MSRALQIRDAIVSLLQASALAGIPSTRIYVDDPRAKDPNLGAYVVVTLGDEQPPTVITLAHYSRSVEVMVSLCATGADPQALADVIHVAADARITADTTLGGLADLVMAVGVNRQRDDMDARVARFDCLYRVDYRTTQTSLE